MAEILTYTGEALKEGDSKYDYQPYVPSAALVKAVNMTLHLKKRPLLLMGEPGVGKTRLAESVAYEILGPTLMQTNYLRWNIKSTTQAKEGLYRYDSFRRLADAQLLKKKRAQLNNMTLGAKDSYIQPGYLATSFLQSTKEKRSVLLIDEIDKADIDFANDLLNEIENYQFTITETGDTIKRPANFEYPVVIITSNRERELPPAFLRRCLYHYIDFPSDDILAGIINRLTNYAPDSELVKKVLKAFREKRDSTADTEKKPSTSELLDWFQIIDHYQRLKTSGTNLQTLRKEDQEMINDLDLLDKDRIPYAEVLLKTYETYTSNQSL